MLQLNRQARFFLPDETPQKHSNRWSSLTTVQPLRPYLTLDVTIAGTPCPVSGYLINIRQIDHWVQQAISIVAERHWGSDWEQLTFLTQQLHDEIENQTQSDGDQNCNLSGLQLNASPYLWLQIQNNTHKSQQAETMNRSIVPQVQLTQQFEFSAAHRLHCPQWSAEENQQQFGKCNHVNGHGHNYILDITIQQQTAHPTESSLWNSADVAAFETCVNQHVIKKLDHRFLNLDVAEFKTVNPTVENISQIIFGWLKESLPENLRLCKVRVYETAKTWAEVIA